MGKKSTPKSTVNVSTSGLSRGMTSISGTKTIFPPEPTVAYTPEVKAQMDFIVQYCELEVGWFGLVDYQEATHTYLIHRLIVPRQEVMATETDISEEAWAEAAHALLSEGVDTGQMYAWFHSHVNMGVSPSGQDERQVEEYIKHVPVFIRGIVNKKGDSKVDVYYRDYGIAYSCVPERLHMPEYNDWIKDLPALLDKNVKRRFAYSPANRPQQPLDFNSVGNRYSRENGNVVHAPVTWHPSIDDLSEEEDGYGDFFREPSGYQSATSPTTANDEEESVFTLGDLEDLDDYLAPYDTDRDTVDYVDIFGRDWDVDTPLDERPPGWSQDAFYLNCGIDDDALLENELFTNIQN